MISKKKFICCLVVLMNVQIFQGMELGVQVKKQQISSDYKNLLLFLMQFSLPTSQVSTSIEERRRYGYHGIKIPIIKGKMHALRYAGTIIENAQPSALRGYWYWDSAAPADRIFISDEFYCGKPSDGFHYEAEIKKREFETKIWSGCLIQNEKFNGVEVPCPCPLRMSPQVILSCAENNYFRLLPHEILKELNNYYLTSTKNPIFNTLAILWEGRVREMVRFRYTSFLVEEPSQKKFFISTARLFDMHAHGNVMDLDANRTEVTME